MIAIKLMKQGEPWIGEMQCASVPRVGEIVYLGSGNGHEVIRVVYEFRENGHHPFCLLHPTAIPKG